MKLTNDIQLNEAMAYVFLLLVIGGIYELWQWLKIRNRTYQLALGIGLFGVVLIGWANGAIGIIGGEDNPANLMYGAVFLTWLVGSIVSKFKPRGMSRTLSVVAIIQILIPVVALFIWPAKASWGEAGVNGVLIFNSILSLPFVVSVALFRRAANIYK